MYIYQFVKYNSFTNSKHIDKYSKTGAVICFDLEDSIYDWVNPDNSARIKSEARVVLGSIFNLFSKDKFGIRINTDEDELKRDIDFLSDKKIHSIFIPKITSAEQIIALYNRLKKADVQFKELIPIIESKTALSNLSKIVKEASPYFNKLVFGHCDYNLSIGAFPFFHHYNSEYWKWVNKIIEIASANNITFINSVFLNLGDNEFFGKMLSHIYQICVDNFGQATLTSAQSEMCNNFSKTCTGFKKLIDDRSELSVPINYESDLIRNFESINKRNGSFTKIKDNVLLSPQEYTIAKTYSTSRVVNNQRLVFVGGCFPVQYNILFEDLFHQKLANLYKKEKDCKLNIKLIRYERLTNCLDKIRNYCETSKTDKLVFHIRPEPYLRLLKFYYRYKTPDGKIKGSLNISFMKFFRAENFDVYEIERSFPNYVSFYKQVTKRGYKTDLNYLAGTLFGNLYYSVNNYIKLASDIVEYCKDNKIDLTVLGPPVRKTTMTEERFCVYLNKRFKEYCFTNNISYIDTIVQTNKNPLCFDGTGKFATQEYHNLIAKTLFERL